MQGLQYLGDMLEKMWAILTTSPQAFKGGGIWRVITSINGVLGAIGTALLVLFFTVGVIKTCGSFAELKKPETAVKVFIRFAIAKYLIDNCLKLMVNFVTIVQGVIAKITASSSIGTALEFTIPGEVQSTFEGIGILDADDARIMPARDKIGPGRERKGIPRKSVGIRPFDDIHRPEIP